ncbi:hypothetical protein ACUXNS_000504 [Brevibacterium pityocampae]
MRSPGLTRTMRTAFGRIKRDDSGFGTVEYIGVMVVLSILIAGLVQAPWHADVKANTRGTVCTISTGDRDCSPNFQAAPDSNTLENLPQQNPDAPGTGDRGDIIARAMFWAEQPVPYSMEAYTQGPDGKMYRTDCSGFVSMAWGLDTSESTVTLPHHSYVIPKDDLQPGDILLKGGPGTAGAAGHVAIFNGWANAEKTAYYGIEQAGGTGTVARVISYPYDNDASYVPYRKKGL